MKKEDLLNDDFLKQFKSGEELNDFLKQIQKRGIEKMLEGELDGHLGYDKNKKSDNGLYFFSNWTRFMLDNSNIKSTYSCLLCDNNFVVSF